MMGKAMSDPSPASESQTLRLSARPHEEGVVELITR